MILISNQAAVGKGLLDPADLQEITRQMRQTLLEDGTAIAGAYYCLHRPDEKCVCRKPKPAMLRWAADDFNINLKRSIFIGDSDTDVQAARAAGCTPVLFGSDGGPQPISPMDVLVARSATDLFPVAAKYLRAAQHASTSS